MTPSETTVVRYPHVIPALDGFRAIAIMIVILSHVGLQRIVPGQFGVTLFFFLSGYLITTLLRQEVEDAGRIDFRRFYLRRAVRILPAMYVTIGFVALLSLLGLVRAIVYRGLPYDFLFLSNYVQASGIQIGLWSLAVEEHFYLGFPLLLAVLTRHMSFARCAAVCLLLCAIVLGVRVWEVQRLADFHDVNFWTHTRIDSILFGSILALWNNPVADERDIVPNRWTGYAIAAAFLLPTFLIRDEAFRQTIRYTLQGIGLMALFNAAIRDRGVVARLLNNRLTSWIALLSYTLYLGHSAIILAFTPETAGHPLIPTLTAIACAFLYAMAMRRWVESPMIRWRRKVEAGWKAAAPGTPAVAGRR